MEELVLLFEKASKAAERAYMADGTDDSEESRCIEALKAMHFFPVTTSMLISTQVGKRLRRLSKHTRPNIQRAAGVLLEVWKKTVATEAKNGSIEAPPSFPEKTPPASKAPKTSPIIKAEVVSNTSTIVTKANADAHYKKTAKVSSTKSSNTLSAVDTKDAKPLNIALIPKTKDATRDKIRELLAEALAKVVMEAQGGERIRAKSCNPIAVAVSVETIMFQTLGLSKGANKMKYRSIMFNIKDPNNPDFRRKVLLGDVSPGDIVNLTPEEMASDQRKLANEEIKKKALFECERGQARQASTDQFKCGKCHQRKCTYFQMQTRSADEPMTTFVSCVVCNNRWKFC